MEGRTSRLARIALVAAVLFALSLLPASAGALGLQAVAPATARGLSGAELLALQEAIEEEYLAFNTYTAALVQYPGALPFSNIVSSEQQHIDAVAGLFTKYGYPVPGNPGLAPTPTWATRQLACQRGVEVEVEDIGLYDRLLTVTTKADLVRVFSSLRAASLNSHLPAFEACS